MNADDRISEMMGQPVLAIDDRQSDMTGVLVARESAFGVVEISLRGCRARRRFHLRYVRRDWFPSERGKAVR